MLKLNTYLKALAACDLKNSKRSLLNLYIYIYIYECIYFVVVVVVVVVRGSFFMYCLYFAMLSTNPILFWIVCFIVFINWYI